MALWLVRAGKRGEYEDLVLKEGVAVVGWERLGDLSGVPSREALLAELEEAYPDKGKNTLLNWLGQIWPFLREMQPGDLVALPLKQRPLVVLGRVKGPYQYRRELPPPCRHTRPVEWIKEIPRTRIDQDLLYSLGAFMTVCRIQRNNAEERFRTYLEGQPSLPSASPLETPEGGGEAMDLEAVALDQIRSFLSRRFKGHRLTELGAAVLSVQGYKVWISPEGPDGGVDILAGSGELGFDRPRIAVQVKSTDSPVDIKTVRELQGAMKNYQADHGLFVSWGGFKQSVDKEKARLFFEIRLWDSDDLLREILRFYEKLPEDLQAELPLKRIWVLVSPPEGEP